MRKRIELHDEEKIKQINPKSLELIAKYKVDLMMRNRSPLTQQHYILDLQQWLIYVLDNQGNKSVTELTDDDITAFLYYCKSEGNNSERLRLRTSVISAFYKFLRKKHIIIENPVEFIDRPKKGQRIIKQTYLTQEQVAMMREELIHCDDLQLRVYAMLSLSTMARVAAIARLRWDQIDFDNKVIHDVLEKEAKIVELYFSDEVKCLLTELKQYRNDAGINDKGWIFYNGRNQDKPISKTTLTAWCHKIGDMIGVPSLHPHDLRHSAATLLKNAGMPLEDISVLLNHESTETTRKYYIKQDTARISAQKAVYNI